MKRLIFLVLLSFSALQSHDIKHPVPAFKKVIIWGHKLHSHTHSFIHYAYYEAFKYLGYDTYWFDNDDKVSKFDFSNCLFFTEGLADKKIPLRNDCFYILHNCDDPKYKPLIAQNKAFKLQVYTHDCLPRKVVKVEDYIYYDVTEKVLYMPWATDLLPHQIDEKKAALAKRFGKKKSRPSALFVGSVGGGLFGNTEEIENFKRACLDHGVSFNFGPWRASMEDNYRLIAESDYAPAVQGKWQCEKGYIPCRIFKNISYGKPGLTNSKTVYDLFQGKIIYNPDCYQLFLDAQKQLANWTLEQQFELMDFVRDHHTYLNRIDHLFRFMALIQAGAQ